MNYIFWIVLIDMKMDLFHKTTFILNLSENDQKHGQPLKLRHCVPGNPSNFEIWKHNPLVLNSIDLSHSYHLFPSACSVITSHKNSNFQWGDVIMACGGDIWSSTSMCGKIHSWTERTQKTDHRSPSWITHRPVPHLCLCRSVVGCR